MAASASFRATLAPGGPSFMPTQTIVVPAEVLAALGGKAAKRVLATIHGHGLRLGLLPLEGGGRYLVLNKNVGRAVGLKPGDELEISIAPDLNPDHVDLPDELAEALAAWSEAETAFNRHGGAHRRAMPPGRGQAACNPRPPRRAASGAPGPRAAPVPGQLK